MRVDYEISGENQLFPAGRIAYYNSFFEFAGASPAQNARLTITLRVLLIRVTAGISNDIIDWPNGARRGKARDNKRDQWVPCEEWSDEGWFHFRYLFKGQAESFWSCDNPLWGNPGFCLMPPLDWEGLRVPYSRPTHLANVDCDFCIKWAHGMDDAHVAIYGTNLAADAPRPVPAHLRPGTARRTGEGFLTWDSAVTATPCWGPDGAPLPGFNNFIIPHEIGHAIGLPHVGEMRPDTTCMKELDGNLLDKILIGLGLKSRSANIPSCYTGDTVADATNIMGAGNIIAVPNVYPWAFRAAQHTHTDLSKWMICLRPVPPVDLSWFK